MLDASIFANRVAIMRNGIDLTVARCLEIGPLANPLVSKSEGKVTYVDYTDAATLREGYKEDPNVDVTRIVEIDAIWGERSLADCVNGETFDYVLASHVAEHVPDLITWLGEVRSVLASDGQLRLVLPDHRFSFDVLRDETRLVDVLTNWVLRARRPQVHNVLDFRLHFAPKMDGLGRYEGRFDIKTVKPEHEFEFAIDTAGYVRDLPDKYFDVHCWVFQPRTFARLMAELTARGLVNCKCVALIDSEPPLLEFYVFMTPCDDPAEASESWRAAMAKVYDPLPGSAEAIEGQREPQHQQFPPPDKILAARLAVAERQIAALKASTSWRVTAPMRWLRLKLG